ncbi:MAG: hypothetical protein JWM64_2841, partial [Frankiales bacterium]|nr:hypothetical protein [Frankiales bacterium]
MTTGRDRLLAALFAVQLLAATVFGVVLVRGLGDEPRASEVLTAAPGAAVDAALPGAAAAAPSAS